MPLEFNRRQVVIEVPDPQRIIPAQGHRVSPIRRQSDMPNRIRMGQGNLADRGRAFEVPHDEGPIEATRHRASAVGGQRERGDLTVVPLERVKQPCASTSHTKILPS